MGRELTLCDGNGCIFGHVSRKFTAGNWIRGMTDKNTEELILLSD